MIGYFALGFALGLVTMLVLAASMRSSQCDRGQGL